MTSTKPARMKNPDRAAFCDLLRQRRAERELSLEEIATETRIPVRSLKSLESGQFENLPADVFVRGFLRSYARCVGLDADDTVRRYARLGFDAAPVASEMADEVLAQLRESRSEMSQESRPRRRLARGTGHSEPAADSSVTSSFRAADWLAKVKARATNTRAIEVVDATSSKAETKVEAPSEEATSSRARMFLPKDFSSSAGEEGRRGNLTFAVIILVIVATIAMSYLMRRPSHGGDGISSAPVIESTDLV